MSAASRDQRLKQLERTAWLLDSAVRIPGTKFRIGLDSILGLVPGVGDFIGAVLSSYILIQAARSGAPFSILARMVLNILVEAIVGLVPLLGDFFDMAFRANIRNVALLNDYLKQPEPTRRRSRGLLLATVITAVAMCFGVAVLAALFLQWLWTQLVV